MVIPPWLIWLCHLHSHKPENLPFVDPIGGRLPQGTTQVETKLPLVVKIYQVCLLWFYHHDWQSSCTLLTCLLTSPWALQELHVKLWLALLLQNLACWSLQRSLHVKIEHLHISVFLKFCFMFISSFIHITSGFWNYFVEVFSLSCL
jgi:hypothetical protein